MAQTRDFLDNDQNFTGTMGRHRLAQQAYEQGFDDFNRAAFNKGIDPGSGRLSGAVGSYPNCHGKGCGEQCGDAGMTTTDQGLAALMGIVMEGQGLKTTQCRATQP